MQFVYIDDIMKKAFFILGIIILLTIPILYQQCNDSNNENINGIDVSRHNGLINWDKVANDSIHFVYIKATEGATYIDPMFKKNILGAKNAGLLVGTYHYFRMTSGAIQQFNNYKNTINKYDIDLIPMVDVETSDGKPTKDLQDSLDVFIFLIKKEYHVNPMIYGTQRSYNTFCAPKYNNFHLYIGRYGSKSPIIIGKGTYTIWQYTESAIVDGIPKPVDRCKFNLTYSINDILLPNKKQIK